MVLQDTIGAYVRLGCHQLPGSHWPPLQDHEHFSSEATGMTWGDTLRPHPTAHPPSVCYNSLCTHPRRPCRPGGRGPVCSSGQLPHCGTSRMAGLQQCYQPRVIAICMPRPHRLLFSPSPSWSLTRDPTENPRSQKEWIIGMHAASKGPPL